MEAMRTILLLPLLLLGSLQAALAPATPLLERDRALQFRDSPLEYPPPPAESSKAFRRLPDAPRLSVVRGDWKLQLGLPAGAQGLAHEGDRATSRTGIAGQPDYETIQLRPRLPRAPPPALPC